MWSASNTFMAALPPPSIFPSYLASVFPSALALSILVRRSGLILCASYQRRELLELQVNINIPVGQSSVVVVVVVVVRTGERCKRRLLRPLGAQVPTKMPVCVCLPSEICLLAVGSVGECSRANAVSC